MLSDKLRDGAQSGLFKFVLGLIVISFIFTGVGGYLVPSFDTSPAEVGHIRIGASDWNSRYSSETRRIMQFNPQAADMLENGPYVAQLRRAVLEEMISQAAVTSLAWDLGIRIGDDQVREAIAATPSFFREGRFDNDLYLASVRSMGLTPDGFAEQVRAEQSAELITRALVSAWARPMDHELRQFYDLLSEQRTVDLFRMPRDRFSSSIEVTPEQAREHYEQNTGAYLQPATVRFGYLLLTLDGCARELRPGEEELRAWYELSPGQYTDAQGAPQSFEQARTQVQAEYIGEKSRELFRDRSAMLTDASYENPDSLDEAARVTGLTIQDSGLIAQHDQKLSWPLNDPAVQRLCFDPVNLSSGMNSRVVSLDADTAIVINVHEHHPSSVRPFEEVQDEVTAGLRDAGSTSRVRQRLEELAEQMRGGEAVNLRGEGVKTEAKVQLQRGSDRVSPRLAEAIYSLPRGSFSYALEEDGGDLVLAVLRQVGTDAAGFEAYRDFITSQWEQAQQALIHALIYRAARSLVEIRYNEEALSAALSREQGE